MPDGRYDEFVEFLGGFVRDLNAMSDDGWAVLVEGKRDVAALRDIGYGGRVITVSRAAKHGRLDLKGARRVVILTDLDAEGGRLGSRFRRLLARTGVETSTNERARLLRASKGVFRHVENLSRFREGMQE